MCMSDRIDLRLINSKTYKKLFPFLVTAFLLSYLLSFIFLWPMKWIGGLMALNVLVTLIVFIYSKNFKTTGRLSIDMNNIVITQHLKEPLILPISLLEDFKISRGATIHKTDNGYHLPSIRISINLNFVSSMVRKMIGLKLWSIDWDPCIRDFIILLFKIENVRIE